MSVEIGIDPLYEHIGLTVSSATKERRFIHFAWHLKLRDDAPDPKYHFRKPPLPDEILDLVGARVRRAQKKYAQNLPYALSPPKDAFDPETGEFKDGAIGLTCATFVLAVFAAEEHHLVDYESWKSRPAEDAEFKAKVIGLLRQYKASEEHIKRVEQEDFQVRFKPIEVFGAALADVAPAKFVDASRLGHDYRASHPSPPT